MLQMADGTEQTATSAQWSSSSGVLEFNVNVPGFARTHPQIWGETVIYVNVTGVTGVSRSSREVFVMPDGTFRMVGLVTDADDSRPIRDARVEARLSEDPSSNVVGFWAFTTTDLSGRYRLYGVPPESYLHVRRPGYLPITERIQTGSHTSRDFTLRVDSNVPSFEGTYTMTVDATSCTGFNRPLEPQYRLRTYTATIAQSSARLTVRLSDAQFLPNSSGFSGIPTPTGADMLARTCLLCYYFNPPSYPPEPDVAERLADGTFLEFSGRYRLTGTRDRLSGQGEGYSYLQRWTSFQPPNLLSGCIGPRLTLERR
jgi:hypothetical protein